MIAGKSVRSLGGVVVLALWSGCTGNVMGPGSDNVTAGPGGSGGGSSGANAGRGGTGNPFGGNAGAGGPVAHDPSFQCKAQVTPPAGQLRRLSNTQYRNTLRDLFGWALKDPAAGMAVMTEIATALGKLPKDLRASVPEDPSGGYRRMDQDLQQVHVDGAYEVAVTAGAALTTGQRLGKLVGPCATDGNAANDGACLDDFIDQFGSRALRRPLTADDRSFYKRAYAATGIDAAGFADVITLILDAPGFLYVLEKGDAPVASKNTTYALDAYELAARLSYHFWDTLPDDALWAAARSGALASDSAQYTRQVDRLFSDARTRVTMRDFYQDWLKLDALPRFDGNNNEAKFKAFAGADLPTPTLQDAMTDDVLGMLDHYTWTKPGSYDDLMTSDRSFARSGELAKLYGVAAWDGKSEPPALSGRPGLITRAALVASETGNTRPVMKGVFMRRHLLCDVIPAPPANAANSISAAAKDVTTRTAIEQLTETKGSVCASCHATFINALGFATENFDSLGRARTEQRLFDAAGNEFKRLPVDTRTVPRIIEGDTREAANASELAQLILESGKGQACLSRAYFHFAFARWDDPEADGCVLERLRGKLVNKGSLASMLKEVALAPEFRQRVFP